jgi:predicted nucleic acid-binding Zn ribbon protein
VLLDGDIADLQPVAPTTTAAPTLPPVPLMTINPIDIERERANARRKKILIAIGLLLIAGAGWYLMQKGHLRRLFGKKKKNSNFNSFVSNSN